MAFGIVTIFKNNKNEDLSVLELRLKALKSPAFAATRKAIAKKGHMFLTESERFYQNHVRVLEMLILYKKMYPQSNLSECSRFSDVEDAVDVNS